MRRMAHILISIATMAWLVSGGAAECQRKASVCLDGPATRNVDGIDVHRECWHYQDTYECVEEGGVDYCAAIAATPGCNVTSSACSTTAFNGECLLLTKTFACGTEIASPDDVIVLPTSYTIVVDAEDHAQCAAYENNPACVRADHVCTDGPGTKNINGLDVYKDCWEWNDNYNCVVSNPTDYCSALVSAGCQRTGSECTVRSPVDDSCIETKDTYNCNSRQDPLPSQVTYLNSSYTIVSDEANTEACDAYAANPTCSRAAHTCVEGPETRNINGLDVYKDCWRWSDQYTCTQNTPVSDCDELKNNPRCIETKSACVSYQDDGTTCNVQEHEFRCSASDPETTTVTDCSSQQFCIAGNCFDTGYPRDTDFGTVIAGLEIQREAGYNNLFEGEPHKCTKRLFGLVNCCKKNQGAAGASNSSMASHFGSAAFKVGAETIRWLGSPYAFDAIGQVGSPILTEWAIESYLSTNGALSNAWGVSFYGVRIAYDTVNSVFAFSFDPWSLALSIAIHVIMELSSCEPEDQLTGALRGQGLCHKVGSYCTKKVLGSCLEKTESDCCFNSKLARLINEQGRPQIGKLWGDEEAPDCSGFTMEQIGLLSFERMDFSEFIADVMRNIPVKNQGFAVERATTRARSYYEE